MGAVETLTAWTLAATVERQLIKLEHATRANVLFASRPLNTAEKQSKVKFQDIEDIVATNTGGGLNLINGLYGAAAGALLEEVFGDEMDPDHEEDVIDAAVLTGILASIISSPPKRYTKVRDSSAEYMGTLVGRSYEGGVATVLAEAKRQGTDLDQFTPPKVPDIMTLMARDVADHPWQRTLERTLHEYQRPNKMLGPAVTMAELEKFVEGTRQDGTVDLFNQANQAALGAGRNDTVASFVGDFIVAFASEILDKATCGPCSAIDGTRFESLEEAQAAYPAGYVSCQGGSRCRGIAVYVFDEPDEPEN